MSGANWKRITHFVCKMHGKRNSCRWDPIRCRLHGILHSKSISPVNIRYCNTILIWYHVKVVVIWILYHHSISWNYNYVSLYLYKYLKVVSWYPFSTSQFSVYIHKRRIEYQILSTVDSVHIHRYLYPMLILRLVFWNKIGNHWHHLVFEKVRVPAASVVPGYLYWLVGMETDLYFILFHCINNS